MLHSLTRSVILLLLALSTALSAPEPSAIPQHFRASLGGFMGESYQVQLQDGALIYTVFARGRSSEKRTTINPTPEQWREFRQALDKLKVWHWRDSYPTNGVMDGTQWSLDIAFGDQSIKTQGSNNYPERDGKPNGAPEFTESFKQYLDAIKKLTGGKPIS